MGFLPSPSARWRVELHRSCSCSLAAGSAAPGQLCRPPTGQVAEGAKGELRVVSEHPLSISHWSWQG